jgi:hypothetical protein
MSLLVSVMPTLMDRSDFGPSVVHPFRRSSLPSFIECEASLCDCDRHTSPQCRRVSELGLLAGVPALGLVTGSLAIRRQGIYFAMIALAII